MEEITEKKQSNFIEDFVDEDLEKMCIRDSFYSKRKNCERNKRFSFIPNQKNNSAKCR